MVQPDTIVPNPFYPQSLNRYSYGYNNPVLYSDPSGHFPWLFLAAVVLVGVIVVGAVEAVDISTAPAITEPNPPLPTNNDVTPWLVDRINENSNAPVTKALQENWQSGNPAKMAGALKAWVGLVRTGATWDYKSDIIESGVIQQGSPNVTLGGVETNYQAVANIHFGAMAAEVGLPEALAEGGAGAFQIKDHWGRWDGNVGGFDTFFDDPADNYWIGFGYYLHEEYGHEFGSLTPNELTVALGEYITEYGEPPQPLSPGY